MTKNNLLKKKRHKTRLRNLNILPPVVNMTITKTSPAEVLSLAYGMSIYFDNDLDFYVCELGDFNSVHLHASTWAIAAAAGQIATQLLIESYRAYNYPLPEV